MRGAQLAFLKPAVANRDPRRTASQWIPRIPSPLRRGAHGAPEQSPGNSQASLCEQREGNDTGRKKKKKKSKSRKRHNSSWACTRLQPRPHTELRLPHPQARAPARWGPEWAARPSTGLGPADPSPGCAGRTPGKEAAEWGLARRALPEGPGSQNRRPGRGAAKRRAVRRPQPRAGELSMPVRRRPRSSSPQPGAGRREAARAQAGAVAVLTHGGESGGGGYSPEVSPPQPGLHAGGAGGGDGSGPGSARGPWAALGAPAASPGSGSGRALWHEQGGPLHPRRSQARPYPASAAPLGRPAC